MGWELEGNIRGSKGDKGDPGSIASASVESVPADQPAMVIMTGTEAVKHAHFRVPRGLPGMNAVPVDAGVAAYVAAPGTATQSALLALTVVYRLYDQVTGTYPPRVPGAVNIFLGPVHPGLLMAENDRWENPDATTMSAVVAAMLDSSHPLYKATRAILPADVHPLTVHPMTNTLAAFGPAVPGVVWATSLAKGGTNGVRLSGRVPDGWGSAALRYRWLHSSDGGNARLNTYWSLADATGVVDSKNYTSNYGAQPMSPRTMSFDDVAAVGGRYFSGAIIRVSDNAADTIPGPIGIQDAWLVRTS